MIYLLVENMNYTRQLAVLRRNTPELELPGVMDYIIHYFQGSLPYSMMKHMEAFKNSGGMVLHYDIFQSDDIPLSEGRL